MWRSYSSAKAPRSPDFARAITSGTGPATSSESAVTLATPDLKPSSLPFLTCAPRPYRASALFANGPWVPKSSQGYCAAGPAVQPMPQKKRAGLPLGCSIARRVGQIFCLRISTAFATAVASSASTSGGIPALLYFAPVTPPANSCVVTWIDAPPGNGLGLSAPKQPRLFCPTIVARLFSFSASVNTSEADALLPLTITTIGSWYSAVSRRSLLAVWVPAFPVFTTIVMVGSPFRNMLVMSTADPPRFPRRSMSHALAPCASAFVRIARKAASILYVPPNVKSCQVMYAMPPGRILPVRPASSGPPSDVPPVGTIALAPVIVVDEELNTRPDAVMYCVWQSGLALIIPPTVASARRSAEY